MQNQRIKKSKRFFNDAEILYKNKCYASCISRCYYCIFHSALTLLEKFNITSESREHRFILSAFPREFIYRRKLFTQDTGNFLQVIFKVRNIADYELKEFSEKYTKRMLDKTKNISNAIIEVFENAK